MPSQDNDERYEDILQKIAERKPFGGKRREILSQTPHERVLDRINAFDSLAGLTRLSYAKNLCYGPKSVRGPAWSGVVVWSHRKGYHGYQTLNLFGVWAHYDGDDILLSIGDRRLPYRAPVYDAGVYRVAIQNNFKLYYHDAGGPPVEGDKFRFRCRYQERERLTHRRSLSEIVQQWRDELEAG